MEWSRWNAKGRADQAARFWGLPDQVEGGFALDVSQVMESNVRTVGLEETVAQAAQYMSEAGTGCLVVVDGDVPAGIITGVTWS